MKYTDQDHENWNALFTKVMQALPEIAHEKVISGIKTIGFPSDQVPNIDAINSKLKAFTDWQLVLLDEMVDDNQFISMLAHKQYPCRSWLRSHSQIELDENEYDLFHDLVGHTSLLNMPEYCKYLQALGELALKNIHNTTALLYLKRMYWHTIQYGLIISGSSMKIYGAHLLTSRNETLFALSAGVPKYDFNVAVIMNTPYVKNKFQERYFVIDSFDQLFNSIPDIEKELAKLSVA